jgi:hypothetical protein
MPNFIGAIQSPSGRATKSKMRYEIKFGQSGSVALPEKSVASRRQGPGRAR